MKFNATAAAIVVLVILFVWRYTPLVSKVSVSHTLELRAHCLSRKRSRRLGKRTSYRASVPISHIEPAYHPHGRVRAADANADGRHLGIPDNPDGDGRDALPMYTTAGGPPSYIESGSAVGQSATCTPGNDTSGRWGESCSLGAGAENHDREQPGGIRSPPPTYHPL